MPTVAKLADAYRTLHSKQTELDRRITALPSDDIEDKDLLMEELADVVTDLHDTVLQLSQVRAADVAVLRSKAAIIIGIGERDDDLLALALSLAYDVVEVLEAS
jgi:hypothetical protein